MALDSGFARRRAPRNDGVYISGKKKGPLALASGPSLGRKRPRRAAITQKRYRTATICDRAAQSARGFDSFPVQNVSAPSSGTKKSQEAYFPCYFSLLQNRRQSNGYGFRVRMSYLSNS